MKCSSIRPSTRGVDTRGTTRLDLLRVDAHRAPARGSRPARSQRQYGGWANELRMVMERYRYALEICNEDDIVLGQVPVDPDFEPAVEWARFQRIRQAGADLPATGAGRPVIEPAWDPDRGAPYLSGFRVVIPESGEAAPPVEFPATYLTTHLSSDARRASADFVERGELTAGEVFRYRVFALRTEESRSRASAGPGITVEEIDCPLPLTEQAMEPLMGASIERGELSVDDLPVFVPQHVLDEATDLAQRAGEIEVGGVLVGRLCRDPGTGSLFVEITAQLPARHTVANATKLTFTPETWADIDAVMALRGGEELKISWWHYHPNFCRKCPAEARARCTFSSEFFSSEDVHLHRTCFGRAFNVAFLVSALEDRGLVWSCFGWRYGMVSSRGYHVVGADGRAHRDRERSIAAGSTPATRV